MPFIQKLLIFFFLVVLTVHNLHEIIDEYIDVMSGEETLYDVLIEFLIALITLSALIYFISIITIQYRKESSLQESLTKIRKQLDSSNNHLKNGKEEYQKVVQWQFNEWKLSPSEQAVALMLLKGLCLKDIAKSRSTHEKTVRKQASSIYEKSGLNGRHELSAWFFEGLL